MAKAPLFSAYLFSSAHAAAAPWEGKNAMDAAILAYTNVSLLRQQIHPSHRVHGVFEGENLAVNSMHSLISGFLARPLIFSVVIPDKVNMQYVSGSCTEVTG